MNYESAIQTMRLSGGPHTDPSEGACVMEMASLVAGEEFKDMPECVWTPLSYLAQAINDNLDSDERQGLIPLIPRLIGTADLDPEAKREIANVIDAELLGFSPSALVNGLAGLDAKLAIAQAQHGWIGNIGMRLLAWPDKAAALQGHYVDADAKMARLVPPTDEDWVHDLTAMRDLGALAVYARGADHVLGVLDRALPADPAAEIIASFCELPERLPEAATVAA